MSDVIDEALRTLRDERDATQARLDRIDRAIEAVEAIADDVATEDVAPTPSKPAPKREAAPKMRVVATNDDSRTARVVALIERLGGEAKVADLATRLEVKQAMIACDCGHLVRQGRLRRVGRGVYALPTSDDANVAPSSKSVSPPASMIASAPFSCRGGVRSAPASRMTDIGRSNGPEHRAPIKPPDRPVLEHNLEQVGHIHRCRVCGETNRDRFAFIAFCHGPKAA